jgi:predicted nucleic acid-binding protein
MKYILDSSVAFKWVVPEDDSDKANRIRDDFRKGIHQLFAPEFFPFELAHALTRAERQGRIKVGEAKTFWTDAMTTVPGLLPVLQFADRAIDISSQARVGVYDCLYVALAEQEKCELVTADDKLVKNLLAMFPFLVELKSLP